jgi:hypothetical protein
MYLDAFLASDDQNCYTTSFPRDAYSERVGARNFGSIGSDPHGFDLDGTRAHASIRQLPSRREAQSSGGLGAGGPPDNEDLGSDGNDDEVGG